MYFRHYFVNVVEPERLLHYMFILTIGSKTENISLRTSFFFSEYQSLEEFKTVNIHRRHPGFANTVPFSTQFRNK
jgi:hypothetical protein